MNKTVSIIITVALAIAIGIIILGGGDDTDPTTPSPGGNVTVADGLQYVTITAKGGYSPRVSEADAGLPTKLIIKTDGTYDCSLAVVIRSIGYQKTLSRTGEETIDIGTPEAGTSLQGTCSMGMYSFLVTFN